MLRKRREENKRSDGGRIESYRREGGRVLREGNASASRRDYEGREGIGNNGGRTNERRKN